MGNDGSYILNTRNTVQNLTIFMSFKEFSRWNSMTFPLMKFHDFYINEIPWLFHYVTAANFSLISPITWLCLALSGHGFPSRHGVPFLKIDSAHSNSFLYTLGCAYLFKSNCPLICIVASSNFWVQPAFLRILFISLVYFLFLIFCNMCLNTKQIGVMGFGFLPQYFPCQGIVEVNHALA